jgi:hypothetical protein
MKLSLIADICGILGFLFGLYAVGAVVKIKRKIDSNEVNIHDTTIGGDFTGRDRIER